MQMQVQVTLAGKHASDARSLLKVTKYAFKSSVGQWLVDILRYTISKQGIND